MAWQAGRGAASWHDGQIRCGERNPVKCRAIASSFVIPGREPCDKIDASIKFALGERTRNRSCRMNVGGWISGSAPHGAFGNDEDGNCRRTRCTSINRLARRDLTAGAQDDHLSLTVLRAEDQEFGGEAGDVLRRKIADANHERADQGVRFVIGDLRARPHDAPGADIDGDLHGRIAGAGKRLHVDDLADADIETGKVVGGDGWFQRMHWGGLGDEIWRGRPA